MNNIILYCKERFPIIPVILFASGYSGYVIGVTTSANPWNFHLPDTIFLFLSITALFFFYLLRQRAIDEFRDFHHDKKNFPNRPLHRGLVNKNQIAVIGVFALLVEIFFATVIGSFLMYLPVLFYALLMSYDFFIKKWLDTHFTAHFLIHEVYFLILGYFFVTRLGQEIAPEKVLPSLIVLIGAPMSIELMRKYKPRYAPNGKPVRDTYQTVWGKTNTLFFMIALILLNGYCLSSLKNSPEIFIASIVLAYILWICKKKDTLVINIGILQFLVLSLLSNILW